MSYRPSPFDDDPRELPPELAQLIDHLAERVHDVWAARRFEDGWTFGPERDDARREHPGLVPYCELDESERAYDRATAIATVKAIMALGYRLEGPVDD